MIHSIIHGIALGTDHGVIADGMPAVGAGVGLGAGEAAGTILGTMAAHGITITIITDIIIIIAAIDTAGLREDIPLHQATDTPADAVPHRDILRDVQVHVMTVLPEQHLEEVREDMTELLGLAVEELHPEDTKVFVHQADVLLQEKRVESVQDHRAAEHL